MQASRSPRIHGFPSLIRHIALIALSLLASSTSAAPDALLLEPCHVTDPAGVLGVDAECGKYTVPENRAQPADRTIELSVVRVPALTGKPAKSAFTVIQGGPGGSSIDLYLSLSFAFEGIRRERDILLVDQRGTGRSAPLRCPSSDALSLEGELTPARIRTETMRCLDGFDADPRFYTTSIAVLDLDNVRSALGYEQLDLYGASYGTRVALHYLRRFPDRVRTLTIDGVTPVDWILGPTIALDAQASLELLFSRCAEAPACADRFGDLGATFARLRASLEGIDSTVSLRDPLTGKADEIEFGSDELAVAVRMLSYQPETRALLPVLIDAAAAGDLAPIAGQALMVMKSLEATLALGMHNAVVCSEDAPFYNAPPSAADTYLGAQQLELLKATCDVWPVGEMDADFHDRFTSDVPALVLSGTDDPVTPPQNGHAAARDLTNAIDLVGDGQGHGIVMRGCMPRLLDEFVKTADAKSLDVTCVEQFGPTPIFTSFTGAEP